MGLRTILTGVSVSLCALTGANAADMKGGSLNDASPAYNWVGLYVGGTLGYGFGSSATYYNNGGKVFAPDGAHPWTSNDPSGALGGVTVGYNYRLNNKWIAGIEGDLSMANLKGKDHMYWGDGHHWQTGWGGMFTLRGRVGYEYDPRTLIYGTGGLAIIDSSEYNIGDGDNTNQQWSDNSGWKAGWVLGAGVERAFTDRWSGKIEYLHIGLPDNSGRGDNNGTYTYVNDADIVRVGMNYKIH